MKKVAKIFLLTVLCIAVIVCGLFLIEGKPTPVEATPVENSTYEFSNKEIIYDQCYETEADNSIENEDETGSQEEESTVEEPSIYSCEHYSSLSRAHGDAKYFRDSEYILDVIIVNFSDKTTEVSTITEKLQNMQEILSVVSYNKLTVTYNILICNLNEKYSAYDSTKEKKDKEIVTNKSTYTKAITNTTKSANGNMVIFSDDMVHFKLRSNNSVVFWPHCYPAQNNSVDLITLTSCCGDYVFAHEFIHALGICDLYTSASSWWPLNCWFEDNLPLTYDLMSSGAYYDINYTSVANRFMLGWLEMSEYKTNELTHTPIEVISQTGIYTINDANSTNGIIGYQFGENDDERFIIESWSIDGKTFLLVNRINLEYAANIKATTPSECYLYDLRGSNGSWLTEGCYIGDDEHPIVYSDGTRANFSISNIKLNSDGTMQFCFSTSTTFDNQVSTVPEDTANYYLYTIDESNNFTEIQQVYIFNSTTQKWETTPVSLVYVNTQKVYAILNLSSNFTKAKVVYDAFGFSKEYVVNLNQKVTTVVIEKNIIQTCGTMFFGLIDSIKSWFN